VKVISVYWGITEYYEQTFTLTEIALLFQIKLQRLCENLTSVKVMTYNHISTEAVRQINQSTVEMPVSS